MQRCLPDQQLFDIPEQAREPVPQQVCGGFAMHRRGLILQGDRRVIAAADQSAHPRARVDRVEDGLVDVHLLLQVQIDRAEIGAGAVERRPIQTASAAVRDAARRGIGGGRIRKPDDKWLVHLDLDGRDVVVEQAPGREQQNENQYNENEQHIRTILPHIVTGKRGAFRRESGKPGFYFLCFLIRRQRIIPSQAPIIPANETRAKSTGFIGGLPYRLRFSSLSSNFSDSALRDSGRPFLFSKPVFKSERARSNWPVFSNRMPRWQ